MKRNLIRVGKVVGIGTGLLALIELLPLIEKAIVALK